jgi:hypothetical protein
MTKAKRREASVGNLPALTSLSAIQITNTNMESIKRTIMKRDGITEDEADSLIAEAKQEFDELVASGDLDLAEEICSEWFGLEPDYLVEFF